MSPYHYRQFGQCSVTVGEAKIQPVPYVKNLGVYMDMHLTFSKQVSAICASSNYHLRRISSIRKYLTENACKTAVQSTVISRLEYCNGMLCNLRDCEQQRLKRIQNKAARIVTKTPRQQHIKPVLRRLNWLPVVSRVVYKLTTIVFKCLNGLCPDYLKDYIVMQERDSRLRQPHHTQLKKVRPSKKIGLNAFSICAPEHWNSLPVEIRDSHTVNGFKHAVKGHLINVAYT